MDKQVVVLGMHRSGTSLLGAILVSLGVNMGRRMVGKNHNNPIGHFEDVEFVNLNKEIFNDLGSMDLHPPMAKDVLSIKEDYSTRIEKMIKSREGLWGWKDPRTAITIELFWEHLTNPYVIVCERAAMEVAKSLNKRQKLPINDGINVREKYVKSINDFIEINNPKHIVIDYSTLISNSKVEIRRIIDFLGIFVTDEMLDNAMKCILSRSEISRRKSLLKLISLPRRIMKRIFK